MEGYEVITSDDARLGHVVGTVGDNLIIEHGTLRKSKHALPTALTAVHDEERVVRTTVSKQLIEESPKVSDDDVDEAEVAAYYGMSDGPILADEADADQGIGPVIEPDRISAEQERAEIHGSLAAGETYGPPGRQIIPPDPHTSDRSGDERDQ